jgi:hypothetical protein
MENIGLKKYRDALYQILVKPDSGMIKRQFELNHTLSILILEGHEKLY